jgi:bacteriocin resistance YdeI/OmpD-like protein/uncharacterized protein DUF1905
MAKEMGPRRASFRGTLLLGGKTATGIEVPEEVVESLGSGRKPAVRVTIRGHTYRSTVAVMAGKFMLPISAENRAGAGVEAGDVVDVELELDTAPREVTVPADFAEALDQDPQARATFDGLSFSLKQWHVLSIDGAKTAETRERRIAKSINALHKGSQR